MQSEQAVSESADQRDESMQTDGPLSRDAESQTCEQTIWRPPHHRRRRNCPTTNQSPSHQNTGAWTWTLWRPPQGTRLVVALDRRRHKIAEGPPLVAHVTSQTRWRQPHNRTLTVLPSGGDCFAHVAPSIQRATFLLQRSDTLKICQSKGNSWSPTNTLSAIIW